MVVPRSFFGMLLLGTAAPLAVASAVRPTKVALVPRQQAATDQPTVTGYDWNEFLECTSLMEDVASKIQPTPPPEIPLFWFHHPLVEKMKEETQSLPDPETMKPDEWCSMEWWRNTLVPNEKEDGKELVQVFKSWTEHTEEIKTKYRSSVYSLATKCAHMSTLPGDIDVAAMAGYMMSAVATNEKECASARSIMAALTTVDGFSSFGAAAAATTGSDNDAATTSTSTAGAWRGRETGAAIAVVAGIVGAVVGL
ncbi:hypothetical protein QBC40DRAFT_290050 [Triangularia verruculosa]|uniref:Uncharacterized protein n=1 Tax=Triangularia verruculosa TaxID=2587418 RepID=A0AAN7AQJ3_9PEZI|nr:hypothetical protein QBC40DRAFT_290050 [Triangularia verruculosa]